MDIGQLQPAADALAGRVILVTGAYGGLGEAAARACAAAGASVVLLGRRVPKLNRVYDAIVADGGPTPALYPLDLEGASGDDYAEMAERIGSECGRLDGVLHAAAAFKGLSSLANTAPQDWLRALHVNLSAPLQLTRACLPWLGRGDDAAVVFMLNDPAMTASAYWGAYGIAQNGLQAAVSMLAAEQAGGPVRIHGLRPGPMRTALRASAWFGEDPGLWPPPSTYAPACVHLLAASGAAHRGEVLAVSA
ncbi:MAG: SDR family NAD(P)-dependent oxidoreductase [Lysobacteraceae bacterium]